MKKLGRVLLVAVVATSVYRAGRNAGVTDAVTRLRAHDPEAGDKLSDLMAQPAVHQHSATGQNLTGTPIS